MNKEGKQAQQKSYMPVQVSLALLLTMLFVILGVIFRIRCAQWMFSPLSLAGKVALILLLVLCISGFFAQFLYSRHIKKLNIQQMQDILLSRLTDAQKDLARAYRRISLLRHMFDAYSLLLALLAALAAFACAGISGKLWAILPALLAFTGFIRHTRGFQPKPDFSNYTEPAEYPLLHSLAQKAAQALHLKGSIRILLTADCNAGIARVSRHFSLILGTALLGILQEDELYQVLLHEFAHVRSGESETPEYRLFQRIQQSGSERLAFAFDVFYLFADVYYTFHYSLYSLTASSLLEAAADQVITTSGDPQTMVNALAKINAFNLFETEIRLHLTAPLYSEETPPRDEVTRQLKRFKKALAQRETAWRNEADQEIQSRSATHPIFRNRAQALGISSYEMILPDEGDALHTERKKAIVQMDRVYFDDLSQTYDADREKFYLGSLKVLEEWNESGQPLTEEKTRPVVDSLRMLNRSEEAEALCNRIIEEVKNPYATAHARYIKGQILLERGDKAGISSIYEAIDLNSNFLESGLDLIGSTCCRKGWKDELEEYRVRGVLLHQKYLDEGQELTSTLNASDRLEGEPLEGNMLRDILDYIHSIDKGGIYRIYLVRKYLKDAHFTSAFVIEFEKETSAEQDEEVMNKIFEHLDVHPSGWNFSLFYYDQAIAKALSKVKDCCIYQKANT